MSNGFTINECDKCVYVKDTNNRYVIVCLYVDDMLILGSNNYIVTTIKKMLSSKFNGIKYPNPCQVIRIWVLQMLY